VWVPFRQHWVLWRLGLSLRRSDRHLAAMLAIFAGLTAGEAVGSREQAGTAGDWVRGGVAGWAAACPSRPRACAPAPTGPCAVSTTHWPRPDGGSAFTGRWVSPGQPESRMSRQGGRNGAPEHAVLWYSQIPVRAKRAHSRVAGHHRAAGGVDSEQQVLEQMGVRTSSVTGRCCGLAGSWGFEDGKWEISIDCGEQAFLPAARFASPYAVVVANGFSRQTQLEQAPGTGREAMHLAQVMALARQGKGSGARRDAGPRPAPRSAPGWPAPGRPCWPRGPCRRRCWPAAATGDPARVVARRISHIRRSEKMLAAGAMFLLGAGLTAAGTLWPGLYDIGILVLIVAAIGIVVRAGDWARVRLACRAAGHQNEPASSLRADGGELP
jgi:hypothetical protein